MSMTNFLEAATINHILRGIPYASVATTYAGIISALSDDGTTYTEFSGSNYARQAVVSTEFDAASGGQISSNVDIVWPAATANWGSATHIGIFDAAVLGNLLWWGAMSIAKFVARSAVFTIEAGELDIACSGAYSLHSRNGILNLSLRNNVPAFASPANIWAGVGSSPGSQNASLSEPVAGYSRVQVTTVTIISAGVAQIGAPEISFTAVGANWGAMTHLGLYDQVAGGNLLFALQLSPSRAIYDGDGMVFETNSITIRVT